MGPATSARQRRRTSGSRAVAPRRCPSSLNARTPRTTRPCLAWARSRSPSSTSWTRSTPSPATLIPAQPEGYLAANHLWNAASRQITLQAARNEFVAFQVLLRARELSRRIHPARR